VDPDEIEHIQENLEKFLPHLRPEARRRIERTGFMTNRTKEGRRTLAVEKTWCVFFNEGCVLHKVGLIEGDKFRYKPWQCATFPLTPVRGGRNAKEWYVRQWNQRGEAWDLFCLNPAESPKPAAGTLAEETAHVQRLAAEGNASGSAPTR
jgi:hypothetical protein